MLGPVLRRSSFFYFRVSISAAASVLVRQTNIVWVGMAFGITALDDLMQNYATMKRIPIKRVRLLNVKVRPRHLLHSRHSL